MVSFVSDSGSGSDAVVEVGVRAEGLNNGSSVDCSSTASSSPRVVSGAGSLGLWVGLDGSSVDCSSAASSSPRVGSVAGSLGFWVEVGMLTLMAASWALGSLPGWTTAGLVTLVAVRKLRVCWCCEGVLDARVDERRVVGGIVKNNLYCLALKKNAPQRWKCKYF